MPVESSRYDQTTPILPKQRISYSRQTLSSFFASLGSFIVGSILGWSSPAHPDLQSRGSLGVLTDYDLTWISSSCMLGLVLGALSLGLWLSKFGSRSSMLILSIPCIVGWLIMAIPQNIKGLTIGRFITGYCGGGLCVLAPLYISEISHPEIRGRLTTLGQAMLTAGIVYSYAIGALVSWSWLSIACAIVSTIFLGSVYFYLPDSPYHLVEKKEIIQARQVLRWLHGPEVSATYIEEKLHEATLTVQAKYDADAGILNNVLNPRTIKSFLLCLMLFACQQLSGENAIVFYAVEILTKTGSSIGPNLAAILIGILQIIFFVLSSLLVDKIGRKILMILSEAGMSISCLALGLYMYFKNQDQSGTEAELPPSQFDWVPELCLLLYMIMYSIGASSIPWLLMAELCPPQVKGLLSSLVAAFCFLCASFVVTTFSSLINSVGAHTVFLGYGTVSGLATIFVIMTLSETKGKSLYEIQKHVVKSGK